MVYEGCVVFFFWFLVSEGFFCERGGGVRDGEGREGEGGGSLGWQSWRGVFCGRGGRGGAVE